MINVEVFDNHQHYAIPSRATEGAAGYDISASKTINIPPGELVAVPTGLFLAIPFGYEMQIRSRSGLAQKKVVVINSPGTIDSDYRGEIKVLLMNFSDKPFSILPGDRIAQAVFAPVISVSFSYVERLPPTERGNKGFGSTGVGSATPSPSQASPYNPFLRVGLSGQTEALLGPQKETLRYLAQGHK